MSIATMFPAKDRDRLMAERGFTHRIDARVVHRSGQSKMVTWYLAGRVTDDRIRAMLAGKGSVDLNQFSVRRIGVGHRLRALEAA